MEELQENALSNTNPNMEQQPNIQQTVNVIEDEPKTQTEESANCEATTENKSTNVEQVEPECQEPAVDYSNLNRSELVSAFTELLSEDITSIKSRSANRSYGKRKLYISYT